MPQANRIGSIKRRTLEAIANDAAMRLCEISRPTERFVTLSPEGFVEIETAAEAAEVDVVGAYNPDDYKAPRWIGLSRAILEDLKHEIRTRQLALPGVRESADLADVEGS